MFDLQLKMEEKGTKSELSVSLFFYIFKASAAGRIPYYIAEGLEKCRSAAGRKLKCLVRKMTL